MARKQASDKPLAITTGAAPARHKPARPTRKKTSEPETSPVAAAETVIVTEEVAIAYQPTSEQIAKLAYLYWETRGCQGGSPEEDWLRAERELLGRATSVATA